MDTRRLTRHVLSWHNPLARPGDRWEAAVLVVAIVTTLLGLPVAAALGSETYATQTLVSQQQTASRRAVTAVLTADAPGGEVYRSEVTARWTADGQTREGSVSAPNGTAAGSTVRIWLDDRGDPVPPPLTHAGAVVSAVAVAAGSWAALGIAMGLLCVLFRLLHNRISARRWEAEWAATEPVWRRSV